MADTRPTQAASNPQVSIIMPVYNTPLEHVKRAVESITNQTYENIELYIVIDGCSEEYCMQIRDLCEYDARILVNRIDHVGVSGARNYAIEHAHGAYVMFMDSDDEMPDYTVEHALKTLVDNDLDIAFGVVEYRMEKAVRVWHPHLEDDQAICIVEGEKIKDARDHFLARQVPKRTPELASFNRGIGAKIVPVELARSVLFDTAIAIAEDVIFNARIVERCQRIGLVDEVWYIYYQNGYSAFNSVRVDDAFFDHAKTLSKYYGIDEELDNDIRSNICCYFFDALSNEARRKYKGRLKRIRRALKEPVCMDAFRRIQLDGFDISQKRRINFRFCREGWALPIYLFYSMRGVGQRARGESPQS